MNQEARRKFMTLCREIGWKCTAQRLAVYEFLNGNLAHPDVDSVWNAVRGSLPTITRESVYRILNEFAEKGIIRRLDHIDNARYDSRTEPHGHFICESCGAISDFEWPQGAPLPLESLPKTIHHMEMRLVGVCARCEAESANRVSRKKDENASES